MRDVDLFPQPLTYPHQPTKPSLVVMHKLKGVKQLKGALKTQHTIENKVVVFLLKLVAKENTLALMILQMSFRKPESERE